MKMKFLTPILFITLFLFLSGCMTYKPLNTQQVDQFRKMITSEHTQIEILTVRYATPTVEFDYLLKGEISQEEMLDIFYKTKEVILSKVFQKDVIDGIYYKKTYDSERYYPTMSIRFNIKDKECPYNFPYIFESKYYTYVTTGDPSNPTTSKILNGYNTWSWHRYVLKEETGTVSPQE